MPIRCRNCDQADLATNVVIELPGKVRGEDYTVEMLGLKCPHCGYQTVDGPAMPEYGRLLSDKYRAAHGLLTSDDIRKRRERLDMTQQTFADYLGVGIASVKRWEMGKIQDARNNALIIEKTAEPVLASVSAYMIGSFISGSTTQPLVNGAEVLFSITVQPCSNHDVVEQYFQDAMKEPLYCLTCKETGWTTIELPTNQTVPSHLAEFFNRRKKEEHHSHARCH
jgi:putative zinc finger/helix-turn-helix YgiT family protein